MTNLAHIAIAIALSLGAAAGAAPAKDPPADLLVIHGRVYPADGSGRFVQAVAVRGGRIAAVGSDAEIEALRGPRTQVIDAAGGAVTPGLIDTHVHFMVGAATLDQVDVTGARTGAQMTERVAKYAAAHADRPWIIGFGYFPDAIDRRDLDRATGTRPALIRLGDAHSVLANSRALALAGITAATPDPPGGRIVHGPDGEPNGYLLETAQRLLGKVLPTPTAADQRRLLDTGTQAALSAGVTTIVNVGGTDDLALFEAARAQGRLSVRIKMALWLTHESATNELPESFAFTAADADRFDALRARTRSDDMLDLGMVKIMSDGVIESHTAAMLQPYSDDPSTSGHDNYTPEELTRLVTMMDARGWQVMTHALGDRAVRMALDAYAAAKAANPVPKGGRRPKIEHVESIDPADVPRFGEIGVTASLQPDHAGEMNDRAHRGKRWTYIGNDRSAWGWPWKSIKASGGRVAFGSDWPVAPLNIGPGLQVATQRIVNPPAPDQALSVREVIDGYTRDAAWSVFVDKDRGTLEPGKLADIAIFQEDIFARPASGEELPIAATLLGGRIVYQAKAGGK